MSLRRPLALLALWLLAASACTETQTLFDYDGDGSSDGEDCAPTDPDRYPSATDPPGDGIDQNCDGADGVDTDGDGVAVPEDYDDSDATRYPGAEDSWDDEGEVDENCDGLDGIDSDGDGYPSDAPEDDPLWDCDDSDAAVHPGADEDPETPADDNCDGVDGDFDQDGFEVPEDCDDTNSKVYPGATEVCDDIDQDCDEDLVATFSDQDGDGVPDCVDEDVDGDGVLADDDCDDSNPEVGLYGALACPYPWVAGITSCADAASVYGKAVSGDDDDSGASAEPTSAVSGIYQILPPNESTPLEIYCDMGHSGGGWNLVLIASDDGVDTWTFSSSQLLTNVSAPIGSLEAQAPDFSATADYKSIAYHSLPFSDLLFVHHSGYPDGAGGYYFFTTWAAYDGVGDGELTVPDLLIAQPSPSCLAYAVEFGVAAEHAATPHPMTAGTLATSGNLCATDLYFHLGGHGSYEGVDCNNPTSLLNPPSYGPAWAATLGPYNPHNNCGSGPGWSSLGLGADFEEWGEPDLEEENLVELSGLGFGMALGINLAEAGTGINHLRMYLR